MAESVKVIVRCRPLNQRENSLKCKCIVEMSEERGQCSIRKPDNPDQPPKHFTFDGAYFTESTTEQIYNDIAYPLVEGVVEGYNGTVFAYGQTGCGKSFSMQGIENPATQRGIIPRAFQHIFESIEVAENTKYLVHASYLEIYNEEIRDLLSNNIKQKMELKEHPDRGVYVKELSMHPVSNVGECETIMSSGWQNRSVGATLMNADSSRSHSIFTIYLEACDTGIDGGDHIRAGKLNLVDLAGSERQSKTGATGERLREATKINLSLSALGNVISALVDGKSKHIPYRDSKLTRLLQDSLGGNTKTLMVACLSPADNNYEETLSTLRYANRAKNIKNKPRINEDPKDALLREYQEEIKKLRGLLAGQLGPEGIKAIGTSLVGDEALLEGQSPPPRPKSITKESEPPVQDSTPNEDADNIRKEFEEKLNELKSKYEAEQMSNAKLQEDMNKLKSQYDQQAAHYSKMPGSSSHHQDQLAGPPQRAALSSTDTGFNESSFDASAEVTAEHDATQEKEQHAIYIGTVDNNATSSIQDKQIHDEDAIVEQQKEALKRLQMLQQNMVGGEKANDEDAKEKRRKRKKHVDERKLLLARAARRDDEVIMLNVYDSIHDELKARDKVITQKDMELEAAKMEIEDVNYEFERDRTEYLATIRKQEKEIAFLQSLINKIHPTLRRDCNYNNLDKVRNESTWDDDQKIWDLPDLVVIKTTLPTPGSRSVGKGLSQTNSVEAYVNRNESSEEDRYYSKLSNSSSEEVANNYFMPKRQVHQIVSSSHTDHSSRVLQKLSKHGAVSPHIGNGLANGDKISQPHGHLSTATMPPPITVNGNSSNDFLLMRRPHRLDSLDPVAMTTKSRKKKKKHDMP